MGNFRYGKELLNSFGEVFKKPILLLPFVYLFILGTIFLFITPHAVFSPTEPLDVNLMVWVLGLGLIQILISIVFRGMGLAGFRMHLDSQEVTAEKQAVSGCRMYWKLLLLNIYQLMIILIPLVVLFIIYFGLVPFNSQLANIVGIILLVLYVVYILMVVLFFMFSNVIIAYDGKSAEVALTEAYAHFKQNSPHVFFTFVAVLIFMLCFGLVLVLISIPFALVVQTENVVIWQSIVISLISIPISATVMLYLFKAFNADGKQNVTTPVIEPEVKAKVVTKTVALKKKAKKKK